MSFPGQDQMLMLEQHHSGEVVVKLTMPRCQSTTRGFCGKTTML